MFGFKESLSLAEIEPLLILKPRSLGRLLNPQGTGQCPRHPGADGPTAVHEHGVMFPCGCCRYLPSLHTGDRTWAACKLCNTQHNVIPIHSGGRDVKPVAKGDLAAARELALEYSGLR